MNNIGIIKTMDTWNRSVGARGEEVRGWDKEDEGISKKAYIHIPWIQKIGW